MGNVSIDYLSIEQMIEGQLIAARNSDVKYEDLRIIVENERQFTIDKRRTEKTIYVVINYGEASVNFGQSVLPMSFKVITERNTFERAREILMAFATTYNMTRNGSCLQIYTTPRMINAFQDVADGWRATLVMDSTFIIGSGKTNSIEALYLIVDKFKFPVEMLDYRETYGNDLRPQVYPDNGGYGKSISGFATFAFSVTTYYTTSKLCELLDAQRYQDNKENTGYRFEIVTKQGNSITRDYKCAGISLSQKIGENATITATFTL